MTIRNAEKKDVAKILDLLGQVLDVHVKIRPDIFIPGAVKYNEDELLALFEKENRLTYVAVDTGDEVLGYAMCEIIRHGVTDKLAPHTVVYIDDLCVDKAARGQHIGSALFAYVREQARQIGADKVTLNVWEGNDSARAFYDKVGMKPMETTMEYIL